jgi:hypothetical protein
MCPVDKDFLDMGDYDFTVRMIELRFSFGVFKRLVIVTGFDSHATMF